jgi:uncharacterized membrane protein YbaN (DUF454 family)
MHQLTNTSVTKASSATTQLFYRSLGFVFVALGFIGVFLPLIPTTPFLLLAAGCFSKSSERCYQWLISNRLFGPIIKNWKQTKSVSLQTKFVAISSLIVFGGYSTFIAIDNMYLRLIGVAVMITGLVVILRLKTTKR